ncbi:hypothetical protein IQ276_028595 [Desmonostoc muscorum LEGE 12446]|nr:hypothetical protein [Desmonostoc muscorum]MCF2150322.1 hypothetical protein [Desmonostoc muscorum LEGE 12446]
MSEFRIQNSGVRSQESEWLENQWFYTRLILLKLLTLVIQALLILNSGF